MNSKKKNGEKSRAQVEYEKHAAELRRLYVPEPVLEWWQLSEMVRGVWEKQYPDVDKPE